MLKALIILLCLFEVCFFIGYGNSKILKYKNNIFNYFAYGMVEIVASFEVVALISMACKFGFKEMAIVYGLALGLANIVCVIHFVKTKAWNNFERVSFTKSSLIILGLFIVLLGVQVCFSTYLWHTDADDGYYITLSNAIIKDNVINYDGNYIYNGFSLGDDGIRTNSYSWEALVAAIAMLFHINVPLLCHSVLQVFLIIMCYMAYGALGKKLFSESKYVYSFLFFLAIINIMSGFATHATGCVLLVRIWQGKELIPNLAFPLLIASCIDIYANKESVSTWVRNALIVLAGMAFSVVGIYLMPLMYLMVGVPYLCNQLFHKDWKRTILVIRNAVVSMLPIVIFDLYELWEVLHRESAQSYLTASAPNWIDVFWSVVGDGRIFFLSILCIVVLVVMFRRDRGTLLLGGITVAVFVSLLNPLFITFVSQRITGVEVYWRLYWLIPINVIIAFCFTKCLTKWNGTKIIQFSKYVVLSLVIIGLGNNIYTNSAMFANHLNWSRIPDEVVASSDQLEELGVGDSICIFPQDISYFVRQYDVNIKILRSRDFSTEEELIPDTTITYEQVSNAIYQEKAVSDQMIAYLKQLNVKYIYTREEVTGTGITEITSCGIYGKIYEIK